MSKRILIVGAGEAGRMLARELRVRAAEQYTLLGFVDDNPALTGADFDGSPVLGVGDDLPRVVKELEADEVIISVPSAGRDFVRRVVRLCRDAGVPFRIVPGLLEIIDGPVHLEQIRDVHPEDLLGRDSVAFDDDTITAALSGKTVMVTGAGGSIGSEICRQLCRFGLDRLVLFGRGENQVFEIENELRGRYPGIEMVSVIGDIRDAVALRRTFERISPEYVYHAAAHKHVHYMEAFPEEAVKNNIVGTWNVIEASVAAGVDRVVMLSTDKAVTPTGVMGATKRIGEYLMKAAGRDSATRFISVRFGNVLASRGSVVPLFIRQIRSGGPVTVSDEAVTRFFMSIREACMLVVQASLMGQGGEIYILRMGEPIRIAELARDLIALHGYRPDVDVPIEFTGLRPGEKMHEDLVNPGEVTEASDHEHVLTSLSTVPEGFSAPEVVAAFARLAEQGDGAGIRNYLQQLIPDAALGATTD
jgi:FlaA1/EpsC-like NDP-sugar epimerase